MLFVHQLSPFPLIAKKQDIIAYTEKRMYKPISKITVKNISIIIHACFPIYTNYTDAFVPVGTLKAE